MPEFTGSRDIRSYIRSIWRWKFLIVFLIVASTAVAYLLEHGKPSQYSATATVSVDTNGGVATSGTGGNDVFTGGNVTAIAQVVTTNSVADIAAVLLKPAQTASEALSGVSASADITTNFITITVVKDSPTDAATTANAFASALNVDGSDLTKTTLTKAIATTKAQIAHVPKTSSNYSTLEANLQTYEAQIVSPNNVAAIVQAASPVDTPIGPHPRRAAELGLVIGILLSIAVVMLLDSADRRFRSPDELEQFTTLPLLAAIAPSAFAGELETTPVDEEAFQTLRTALTYFTIDREIKSVLIASPGEQEGKSTVAVRLALASARAGLDVVLIDADLRRAGATSKLGLKVNVGLGLVLAERRPVDTALIDWPLAQDDAGRLRVLGAGDPPPNPAALLSSDAMRELLSELESRFDLVVIDTPAALAVSDSVPLLQSVSGVVLIARMNRTTRDTVRRLLKIINSAHGKLLGSVATGVTSGPGYEKYSQAYYSQTGGRRGRRKRIKNNNTVETVGSNGVPANNGVAPLTITSQDTTPRARAEE
jgi:capsular exopolysaccharide synthesis family protein